VADSDQPQADPFSRHADRLLQFVQSQIPNGVSYLDPQDIVQASIETALGYPPAYQWEPHRVYGYLKAVACGHLMNAYRRRSNEKHLLNNIAILANDRRQPFDETVALSVSLESLGPLDWHLLLRTAEGWTAPAIALTDNVTVEAVESRLRRSRAKAQSILLTSSAGDQEVTR
jgi:DNA-directed RNA polymerase specialized sigma24 family protein